MHLLFSCNLLSTSSSFTAEYIAIIEARQMISSFPVHHFLIMSNSMSCLEALGSNILLFTPFQFLWVPGHVDIIGNEISDDRLAKKSEVSCCP